MSDDNTASVCNVDEELLSRGDANKINKLNDNFVHVNLQDNLTTDDSSGKYCQMNCYSVFYTFV